MTDYENRYVCYIDILGFKNAILDPKKFTVVFDGSPNYFLHALEVLQKELNKEDCLKAPSDITQCSDGIAVSFLCCHDSYTNLIHLKMLFDGIARLQQTLLEGGFPTRGTITKGDLYHQRNIIFGPALVEAVILEKKEALYPRVILSQSVSNDIQNPIPNNLLNQDYATLINNLHISKSDHSYIDYIRYWHLLSNEQRFNLVEQTIEHGLNNPCSKIREKYVWIDEQISIYNSRRKQRQ